MAVTVAEGLPGTKKSISDALGQRGLMDDDLSAHEEIDLELDHQRYTRRFMKEIGWIDNQSGKRAISDFLLVVELTQRGWEQIVKFAESSEISFITKPFSISPKEVLFVWS